MTKQFVRKAAMAMMIAAAPIALAGCAATLKPAANATPAPDGGATATTSGGVTVVTMTPDFPGMTDIQDAVTPVKVSITNNGDSPLPVRYSDFTLVAPDGKSYPALPLREIKGTATKSVSGFDTIDSPDFAWSGFHVAPYYGGVYPGIPVWGGGWGYGYGRYGFGRGGLGAWNGWDGYNAAFVGSRQVKLPTPAMYRNGLPEGVLDPKGTLTGWLYFQHVKTQKGAISFDATVKAVDGKSLGSLTIPYNFVK